MKLVYIISLESKLQDIKKNNKWNKTVDYQVLSESDQEEEIEKGK